MSCSNGIRPQSVRVSISRRTDNSIVEREDHRNGWFSFERSAVRCCSGSMHSNDSERTVFREMSIPCSGVPLDNIHLENSSRCKSMRNSSHWSSILPDHICARSTNGWVSGPRCPIVRYGPVELNEHWCSSCRQHFAIDHGNVSACRRRTRTDCRSSVVPVPMEYLPKSDKTIHWNTTDLTSVIQEQSLKRSARSAFSRYWRAAEGKRWTMLSTLIDSLLHRHVWTDVHIRGAIQWAWPFYRR